jgi:hypothetical protein
MLTPTISIVKLTADVCEGISFVMHENLEKWFGLVYGV